MFCMHLYWRLKHKERQLLTLGPLSPLSPFTPRVGKSATEERSKKVHKRMLRILMDSWAPHFIPYWLAQKVSMENSNSGRVQTELVEALQNLPKYSYRNMYTVRSKGLNVPTHCSSSNSTFPAEHSFIHSFILFTFRWSKYRCNNTIGCRTCQRSYAQTFSCARRIKNLQYE
jgi:hypothetical protein